MESLEKIKKNKEIINDIDWDMTPEEAVTLYLEWGNNWSHGRMVKSKKDASLYFVVDTWQERPMIFLIRRNSEEAVELATIEMPDGLGQRFMESVGHNRGVYGVSDEIRTWLEKELSTT